MPSLFDDLHRPLDGYDRQHLGAGKTMIVSLIVALLAVTTNCIISIGFGGAA